MLSRLTLLLQSFRSEKFYKFNDDDDDSVVPPEKAEFDRHDWSLNCNESIFYNDGPRTVSTRGSDLESIIKFSARHMRSEKLIVIFGLVGLGSMLAASCLAYNKWAHKGSDDALMTPVGSPGTSEILDPSGEGWNTFGPTPSPLSWAAVPLGPPNRFPTPTPTDVIEPTYIPGNLTTLREGLLLSEGLDARIIAITDQRVPYYPAGWSDLPFHGNPDAGATFPDPRPNNPGGWIYVSNSEMKDNLGGVGAFTIDKDGNVLDYQMVLENSTMNCGGGPTPWNTWVSCEELENEGVIYQVDPTGEREAEVMTLGSELGRWESFAYDIRNRDTPRFFATEDHRKGTVRRFTPDFADWNEPWSILHGNGTTDYLMIFPNETLNGGTYNWTNDIEAARDNARAFYPMTEGIDVYQNEMFFVCKLMKVLFVLDLDSNTYYNGTTVHGMFDGKPDQVERILGDSSGMVYFTEEGGVDAGVHARDRLGRYLTVFESPVYPDETTGLAFSPDGRFMYTAYQDSGILYQIWRKDGLPFYASRLDVKYHQA